MQEQVYRPLLEVLAEGNHKPKSLGQIVSHARLKSVSHTQTTEAVLALTGTGHVCPARVPTSATHAQCKALNRAICLRSRSASDINFLASPVVASGIPVNRVEQLFILAVEQREKSAVELAAYTWKILQTQGHRLVKDGKTLESAEQNIAHLTTAAQQFLEKRLHILKGLDLL
jgi:hypothetical protein